MLLSLVVAALVLVPIAVFESVKHWLLYSALDGALGVDFSAGRYLGRDGFLRALATAGHSIVLGYVMAIALLLHFGLRHGNPQPRAWALGLAALGVGLAATVSRGPWVGAAVGILAMTLASRRPGRRLVRLILVALAAAVVLAVSPWGEKVVENLPFVGSISQSSVTYRQRLFEISMQVIDMNPWFGSPYFMNAEPMQELRSGNLIDIVNTYLMVALRYGYVGLAWFCVIFAAALRAVITALRRQTNEDTERFVQGQAILGMLVAVLVTIATASDISFIPILWWSVAGLAIGYGHLVAREAQPEPVARRRFAMSSS
jgi:O-antigen ligase